MKFENMYCLSCKDYKYQYTCKVFKHFGLPEPKLYKGVEKQNKPIGCLFGHMGIIMMARCLDFPYVFVFEDDAYPRKDVAERLDFYIKNRPKDCGVMVLGRNGEFGPIVKGMNFHIVRHRPFGAHAYIVFKNGYDETIDSMEQVKIADIALRGDNFKTCKPYWTNDNLFIQRNLDNTCMSANLVNKHGHFFYPKQNGGLGIFDKFPNESQWIDVPR